MDTHRKASPGVGIVRVDESHAELLAGFFRKTWDPQSTPDRVSAGRAADRILNPALADGSDTPSYIFIREGVAIGYVSSIPVRVWSSRGQREVAALWVKGLMVLPEFQRGPIGVLLARELLKHHPTLLALTVQEPARRLFVGLGFKDLGALPTRIRILDPYAVLHQIDPQSVGLGDRAAALRPALRVMRATRLDFLAGALGKAVLAAWSAVASAPAPGIRTDDTPPTDADLGNLWDRLRDRVGTSVIRDAAYLRYRYLRPSGDEYSCVRAVNREGTLLGIALVKHPRAVSDPRLAGLRIATLSDLLFDPREASVATALAAGCERVARSLGSHAIVCSSSIATLDRVLGRRAWLTMPGTFHFYCHEPAEKAGFPDALSDWWLTRGDGGSDGAL